MPIAKVNAKVLNADNRVLIDSFSEITTEDSEVHRGNTGVNLKPSVFL
jgi:hypothetical protein